MIFFGIEIFDGIPYGPMLLDENTPLEEQWEFLTEDIVCIDYKLEGGFEFCIDVGWVSNSDKGYFLIKILEGPVTDGGVFFNDCCCDIQRLKVKICEAVALIQSMKKMEKKEIINFQIQ